MRNCTGKSRNMILHGSPLNKQCFKSFIVTRVLFYYSFSQLLCKIWIVLDFYSEYTAIMPQRRHLPVGDMERIIRMLLTGQSQRDVGCQFNISHTVVGRVWQRYLDNGSVVERGGRGRPRKTTDRDDRYIVAHC